jgi:hydrogenase maturation protein HypF
VIEVEGPRAAVEEFGRVLEAQAPPMARIMSVTAADLAPAGERLFTIAASTAASGARTMVPPDTAVCDDCLRELRDPADRRYRHPFITCTNCGPRYSIITAIPYDRPNTTMASFPLCLDCSHEYNDPADRRFHAQPIACPACGPRVRILDAAGTEAGDAGDAIDSAAQALREGWIVAVKGLGGYHLACDATSRVAVRRLRERKKRDEKPFAVMVADADAARRLADVDLAEERLLGSVERPVVLVRQRAGNGLAPEVAPGNPLVGLVLAYTPLHHLLARAAERPLVMTSGNLSEEPMAAKDDEAVRRLGGIADLFLAHDREIENRCDDSVARVIAGKPTVFRRSRGYVPRPVPLCRPVRRPVLACGAHLKNTFCLAAGDEAWLGPHIGDLDNLEATRAFEAQVERLQRFLGIRPEVIAHDLHPDYASTRYALARPEPVRVGVQHHHAHVAAAMGEHGLEGPVLGLAWDGTGYGTDGTAWGGELLLVREGVFERLATLRPLRLAGSDEAIRQVWRIALVALDDAFDGAPPLERLRLFESVPARDIAVVRQMAARGLRSPLAHGAGATSTHSARWGSSGHGPPTKARWLSSGTSRPRRRRGGPTPSPWRQRATSSRPTCGRSCARRSGTSWPESSAVASRRASTKAWPTPRRRSCGGPPASTGGCRSS